MNGAPLRLGSLCSGYGGLDLAAEQVLGARTVWQCQYEPPDKQGRADRHQYAARILARHWPGVPNHGDITAVDWSAVEPVDVLTAGFPCTDVSSAGKRAGIAPGTRSGLWTEVARAIGVLRPSLVVIENVRGLLSARAHSDVEPCPWCLGDDGGKPALRALGAVLGDLASLGFDAEWHGLPAADVGAAHARFRVFVLAWPADTPRPRLQGHRLPGRPADGGGTAADTDGLGGQGHRARGGRRHEPAPHRLPAAHSQGDGRPQGRTEPARQQGRPDAPLGRGGAAAEAESERHRNSRPAGLRGLPSSAVTSGPAPAADPDRGGLEGGAAGHRGEPSLTLADADGPDVAWGRYAAAVHRWATVLGRPAPAPTDDRGRLAPVFVEWLMGLPPGWVTDTPGLPRSAQLKALGNGVVPQQAAAALRHLIDRADLPQPLAGADVRSAA